MPIVKTKYLFLILLRILKPALVLDVGSLDGADSLRFRRMLPKASLLAFEANPYLYQNLIHNRAIQEAGISVINKAVCARDTDDIPFFVSPASVLDMGNKGTSSINRAALGDEQVQIMAKTTRLDEHIDASCGGAALWIDVEGAAYEVLSTVQSRQSLVSLIHIETETKELWKNQRLKHDVVDLARSMGFEQIAQSSEGVQQDIVFVNRRALAERRLKIELAVLLSRISGPLFARVFEFFARMDNAFHPS